MGFFPPGTMRWRTGRGWGSCRLEDLEDGKRNISNAGGFSVLPSLVGSLCIGRTALLTWWSSRLLSSSTFEKSLKKKTFFTAPLCLRHLFSHGVVFGKVELLHGIVSQVVQRNRLNICVASPSWVIVPAIISSFLKHTTQCVECLVRSPCILNGPVHNTMRRRGWYRIIFGGKSRIKGLKSTKMWKNVFCAHSNKLGQIYVQWDTKTQILR